MGNEILRVQTVIPEALAHLDIEMAQSVMDRVAEQGGEEHLRERFGLGLEELGQVTSYGDHSDPFIFALTDPSGKCPVGNAIEKAYAKDGIDGVEKKVGELRDVLDDDGFQLTISQKTRDFSVPKSTDVEKKKRTLGQFILK
jgi:hypothetical protein